MIWLLLIIVAVGIFLWWSKRCERSHFAKVSEALEFALCRQISAARADGPISDKEERAIREFWRAVHPDRLATHWQKALASQWSPEQAACSARTGGVADVSNLATLVSIMCADGYVTTPELQWLGTYCAAAGMDQERSFAVVGLFSGREGNSDDQQKWRTILDVVPGADLEAIKRAYRAKASEYHPDKLHSASEGVKRLAEEKLKEINGAYQHLISANKTNGSLDGLTALDTAIQRKPFAQFGSGDIVVCAVCASKNRLPLQDKFFVARCGWCHAYLGLDEQLLNLCDSHPHSGPEGWSIMRGPLSDLKFEQ